MCMLGENRIISLWIHMAKYILKSLYKIDYGTTPLQLERRAQKPDTVNCDFFLSSNLFPLTVKFAIISSRGIIQ
jgi:hypothetical protein